MAVCLNCYEASPNEWDVYCDRCAMSIEYESKIRRDVYDSTEESES